MLLICASEVQKHRRVSKNLATRKTQQMLVTAESPPPWTLTSDRHQPSSRSKQHQRQQNVATGKTFPPLAAENGMSPPSNSSLIVNGDGTANGFRGRNKSTSKRNPTPSAQNNRQNSADPNKSEQRKVRTNKNQKKQVKSTNEMISSRPSSTGKLDDAFNRNEKNDDRRQQKQSGPGGEPAAAAASGAAGKPSRKTAASNAATTVKKQRTTDANYQHPWLYTTLKGHTGQVFDMDFSRNGKYLATCAEDRILFLWSTKEFASAKNRRSFRINVEYDYAVRVRWSPDGRALVAYKYSEGCVEVYKVDKSDGWFLNPTKGSTFPRAHMEDIVGFGIAPDGKYLMTCSNKTDLTVWDVRGNVLEKIDTFLMTTYNAKISPCGKFIGACGFTSDVPLWEVKFSRSGEFQSVQKAFDLSGHKSGIYDFAFDQDSSKTVTVCKDGTWKIYNTNIEYHKGEMPRCLVTGTYEPTSAAALVAISPSGEVVAIGTGNSIQFFNAMSGLSEGFIENMCSGQITALQFDSMGKYLLVCADRYIRIFHNIPGYKVALESAVKKLKQPKMSAAMRERIEMQINENEAFLKKFE